MESSRGPGCWNHRRPRALAPRTSRTWLVAELAPPNEMGCGLSGIMMVPDLLGLATTLAGAFTTSRWFLVFSPCLGVGSIAYTRPTWFNRRPGRCRLRWRSTSALGTAVSAPLDSSVRRAPGAGSDGFANLKVISSSFRHRPTAASMPKRGCLDMKTLGSPPG